MLFNKKNETKYANLKGKVQCNEDCEITLTNGEKIHGRINELNWIGFIIDFIDEKHIESINKTEGSEFGFEFKLPREFGLLNVNSTAVAVTEYEEIVTGGKRIKMVVSLEGKPELKSMQDFINYRNRRFARHAISRKSIVWLNQTIFLTFIYIVSSILIVAVLFVLLWYKFS